MRRRCGAGHAGVAMAEKGEAEADGQCEGILPDGCAEPVYRYVEGFAQYGAAGGSHSRQPERRGDGGGVGGRAEVCKAGAGVGHAVAAATAAGADALCGAARLARYSPIATSQSTNRPRHARLFWLSTPAPPITENPPACLDHTSLFGARAPEKRNSD